MHLHHPRTEQPVPSWLNRMAGGVHSAMTTYKAASLSMHQLSEQLHNGWKWMASGGAVPAQLHACQSTPTLPSEGRLAAPVAPPRRGQDVLLEGTLGVVRDDGDDDGRDDQGDALPSCLSPADGRLAAAKSAPVLRERAHKSIARP